MSTETQELIDKTVLQPYDSALHLLIARNLNAEEKHEEALEFLRKANALDPNNAAIISSIAVTLDRLGRFDEASELADTFYSLYGNKLNCSFFNWNYSLDLLRRGELQLGFHLYNWRKVEIQNLHRFHTPSMIYSDTVKDNATVLVHMEQGFGDIVLFSRFLKDFKKEFNIKTLILECHLPIMSLLMSSFGDVVDIFYAFGTGVGQPYSFDYHISIADIPYMIEVKTLKEVTYGKYITPSKIIEDTWREGSTGYQGKKIGICWYGNPAHSNDSNRSMNLPEFLSIFNDVEGHLVGLVQGLRSVDQIPENVSLLNVSHGLVSIEHLAALMKTCDVIVTVDTLVTHLAGAMQIPCYCLIPFSPDWRWGLYGETSPWFPSVKLIRQKQAKDWSYPISEINSRLKNGF